MALPADPCPKLSRETAQDMTDSARDFLAKSPAGELAELQAALAARYGFTAPQIDAYAAAALAAARRLTLDARTAAQGGAG